MRYHQLGELQISTLCYGTAGFGTSVRGEEMLRLYAAFREAGGNFFDTAHCYAFWTPGGLGVSERALGDCLRHFGEREAVVIGSKGGHPDGGADYPRPDRYLAPEVIHADVDDSLNRLGVECIDLYWLHRDDTREPVGAILDTLNAEIRRGRIRYPGASNWSTARIAEANAYAATHGLVGFAASQPQWNLAWSNAQPTADPTMRFLRPDDQRWHAASGLPVIPFSSTACGYFASGGQTATRDFDNPTSRLRLQRAQVLATELGCTPNQVALAYLLHQPFPVIPILGTTKPTHLHDALGAVEVVLNAEQVAWLSVQA